MTRRILALTLAATFLSGMALGIIIAEHYVLRYAPEGIGLGPVAINVKEPKPHLVIDKERTLKTVETGEAAWIHWECDQGYHVEPMHWESSHHPVPVSPDMYPKCVKDLTSTKGPVGPFFELQPRLVVDEPYKLTHWECRPGFHVEPKFMSVPHRTTSVEIHTAMKCVRDE